MVNPSSQAPERRVWSATVSITSLGVAVTVRCRGIGAHAPMLVGLIGVLIAGSLSFATSVPSAAASADAGTAVTTGTSAPPGTAVTTDSLRPRPRSGPFSMNLYESGDFAHQQTEYWCVAASVQTMINIIDPERQDVSRRTQRQLHFHGRRLDQDDDAYWRRLMGEARWRKGFHGLGLTDWAELLNANGYGPYEVARAETRKQAIRKAARAVRLTGRPAGLVVWRGAHAWVMSGFKATADPAFTNDFKVKKVFIQDPWYPSVSSIWGASRPPDSAVPVKALDEDYLRYDRPRRKHPKRDGRYMLILPALSPAEVPLPDVDIDVADQPSSGSSSIEAELMQ